MPEEYLKSLPTINNIKAIILDVDGVLIGTKRGFNFSKVHPKIINRLKQTQNS